MSEERIQKALARTGLYSRRQIESLIQEKRIRVNGKVVPLGFKVTPGMVVECENRRITIPEPTVTTQVLLYHKPLGEVTTRADEKDRATVFEHLPKLKGERWIAVGRLDINTEGLLLFTNDGLLAHRLMHPRTGILREYAVRVFGEVTDDILAALTTGTRVDDQVWRFKQVKPGDGRGMNRWFNVVITEGHKREVRRLWEAHGLKVSRLIRVAFAGIKLPRDLEAGETRLLSEKATQQLMQQCGMPV